MSKVVSFSDKGGCISGVIEMIRSRDRGKNNSQIVCVALIEYARTMRLTNDERDFLASVHYESTRDKDRRSSYLIYQGRNYLVQLVEMILKDREYKSIDEKRRKMIKALELNRHCQKEWKLLRKMTYRDYDTIKRQGDIAVRSHNLPFSAIRTIGYERFMSLRSAKRIVDATPKKKKAPRGKSSKNHRTGQRDGE